MEEVIRNGLLGELNTMRLLLNEYKDKLNGVILTENEFVALRASVTNIYERLVRENITKESSKEEKLWL